MTSRAVVYVVASIAFVHSSSPSQEADFRYRVSADGHYMNGNFKRWYANTRLNITISNPMVAVTLSPSLLYGQAGRLVYDRDIIVTAIAQLFPIDQFFGHGIVAYDVSKRVKLESRWQSGAGLGINILRLQQHTISLSHAFLYENTHFNFIEGNRTWRWSFRLKGSHQFFDKAVILTHETYYQPSVEQSTDIRWRAIVSLDFPITKSLSFRTTLDNNHESIVLTGRKQDDLRWTFGVSVGN